MKVEESFSTNLTKFYITVLLRKKPRHGYELITNLGHMLGKKPSPGQIYPLMKLLTKKKIVTVGVKTIDGRKRKVYSLTPQGRRFSADLVRKFDELVEIAIEPSLSKCAHCGCSVYKGGYKARGKVFCCEYCARACH